MTTTVNYKAAEGFVLCWIPEGLRPINILADWNDLKAQLAASDDSPQFPNRVFNAQIDEYCDILPYQAKEILDAWHEEHKEPEPEPSDDPANVPADPANEGKEAEV